MGSVVQTFDDQALVVQEAEARSASHLFQALFGGVTDNLPGSSLTHWNESFRQTRADHPDMSYRDVLVVCGRNWLASDEFKALYGVTASNAEYLSAVYIKILGHLLNPKGFDDWLSKLDNNALTREQLLAEFTKSLDLMPEADEANLFRIAAEPYSGDHQAVDNRWSAKGAGHSGIDMATSVGDLSVLPGVLTASLLPAVSSEAFAGDGEGIQYGHEGLTPTGFVEPGYEARHYLGALFAAGPLAAGEANYVALVHDVDRLDDARPHANENVLPVFDDIDGAVTLIGLDEVTMRFSLDDIA